MERETITIRRLEDAMDACRTMAGWTDSAVRACDYQEAEAALRALIEILDKWLRSYDGDDEDLFLADSDRLASLLSKVGGPTRREENDA